MPTLIFIIMLLSWLLFIASVLLMTPKWGIWFWIWWMSTSNEYGSKKSVESTLKKTALISIVIFMLCSLIYPYLNKQALSTWRYKSPTNTSNNQNIQLIPSNIKIDNKTDTDIKQNNNVKQENQQNNTKK